MKTKKKYNNTESKRKASTREHLSNASLIGLANLYGVDMMINIPVIPGNKDPMTNANLSIEQTSVTPVFGPEIEASLQSLNRRNQLKSKNALLFNQLADYIFATDPYLQCQLTKSRSTQKTIKLVKYKCIDPFNEEGFKVFGEGVIQIILSMSNNIVDANGKRNVVYLSKNDPQIGVLYTELLKQQELLSVQGKVYATKMIAEMQSEQQMVTTVNDSIQQQMYQMTQDQLQLQYSNDQLNHMNELNQVNQVTQIDQLQQLQQTQQLYQFY